MTIGGEGNRVHERVGVEHKNEGASERAILVREREDISRWSCDWYVTACVLTVEFLPLRDCCAFSPFLLPPNMVGGNWGNFLVRVYCLNSLLFQLKSRFFLLGHVC